MKLDEVTDMWDKDAKIDHTELGQESLNIPQLHAKYIKIYQAEKLLFRKLHNEMKVLKRDKKQFFIDGPTAETQEKGWQYPARGKIMKTDTEIYSDADKEMQEMQFKLDYQQEKIETLESIIKMINNRNFQISNAINWHKFQNGG